MPAIELDSISNNTRGIPDCWHLDPSVRSNPGVFQKHFGLPRSLRHDKRILEFALVRTNRLANFVWRLLHYRNQGTPIMLMGDRQVSPEAHAMARYDEGWHLRTEEELIEVSKLGKDALDTKLADLLEQKQHKDFRLQQVKLQALANRSSTTVDRAYEVMCKCAIETWLRARNDLASWDRHDAAAKQLLAEVIFAGFTFFGRAALDDVADIEAGVFSYYRALRGLQRVTMEPVANGSAAARLIPPVDPMVAPVRQEVAPPLDVVNKGALQVMEPPGLDVPLAACDAATSPTPQGAPSSVGDYAPAAPWAPQSLQELYALVVDIGQQARGTPNAGPEPGYRIRELLEHNLQRLADMQARLSPKEVRALIDRYCDAVLGMVDALEFDMSEQRDLVPVLRTAWTRAVVSALEDGRPRVWFDVNLRERQALSEFSERLELEQARIMAATVEIEEIRVQLAQAKFSTRASLKAKETHKNNEINSARQGLEMIRVEAAHLLVPEGHTLDDLMDDASLLEEVTIEVEGFDHQAVQDLLAVLSDLGPQGRQPVGADSLPALQEPVVDEAQSLPAAPTASVAPAVIHEAARQPESVGPLGIADTVVSADVTQEDLREVDLAPAAGAMQAPVGVVEPRAPEPMPDPVVLEHTSDLPDAAAQCVDEALKHLHWAESREEAQQAFRIAYDQYFQVPQYIAEAVALHWIVAGHLNVAAQILRDANESTLVSDQVLNSSLLRSAFYGMNLWPRDREALGFTQRDLNLVNHKDLEYQLERKPAGKLVPYLLVCATLQPALFAGGETQAATLLKMVADHFEDHLGRLITHTADFTLRGGRVDLDVLRNEQAREVHLAAGRIREQVNTWIDLNQQRTNRWHALRLALRNCIKHPVIADAIAAIKAGEAGDSAAVRLFLATYSSHAESRRLLDDLVVAIRADAPVSDNIDSQAYSTFCQQIDGLVSLSQAWLVEVMPSEMRPKEVQDFVQKFHTLLERSIHYLENHSGHADLEHRAGSTILLKVLTKLQSEIKTPSHTTWRFDQTDATFRLPETLARLDMGDVSVDLRLEWFAMRLTSPNWLADMQEVARRHHAHWVRLLLLRQAEDISGPCDVETDGASNDIAGVRADIKKAIEQFRNLSLQAMSVDIISEGEHLSNVDLVQAWLGELSDRKPYVDVSDISNAVRLRVASIEKVLNSSAAQLEEELDSELLSIRVKVGPDAVPEGWDGRARQALDKRNLSLVRELINQLKEHSDQNTRLVETSVLENAELQAFLQVEAPLYSLLHEHLNPREAGDRVISDRPGGLDYTLHKADFKDAISTLLEWRSKGRNKRATLEKPTYEGIVAVLQFLGVDAVHKSGKAEVLNGCEYTPTGDFRRLKLRISRPTLPKGFPLFEGDVGSFQPLNIIFVQGSWSQAGLIDLIERHGQPDRSILMVGHPLTLAERNAFAALCRERKCTIFLLDPVILSFVATARHQQVMLSTFLRVSAAWTFYNPYTRGDARLPAPPEMRFGREKHIASLVEPRGAALVYGGRQLGKTTLLNAAVQEFKKRDPLHNHAYYMPMDGIFQHVVERGINVKKRLFEQLVLKLVDNNVLLNNASNQQMDPEDRLRQEFLRPGTSKVLFCLDEIDSVLNKDAATNFELVRALKGLVNDPHNRFRVVFAGLNNVNRFRTYPNVPLEQLGSPLEVGILSSQDARSLIVQPITALGYRFEESELVDRILAFTNRHPSLLHIFCSELVEQLGRDRTRQDAVRLVRQTDVENIENNSDVRRLSGERFDMTLNLDKRYTVAVYGLIAAYDKSIGQFTVGQALDAARTWVPEEFEQMSESGFESILLELVGLGVLREDDKAKHRYALRNQSILQLIGSMSDIQNKLQQAITGLKDHEQDVLTCHATGSGPHRVPSPLSLQDERMILSAKPPEGAPKYSVSLVMGSPALGMTPKDMQEGFNSISEFQSGSAMAKYETQMINDAATVELRHFSERMHTAIDSWAAARPAVVLISLENCHSIDRIMDLIGIANEKASKATRLKHHLRIVFLFGPKAMWTWYSHAWLTSTPHEVGGEVELNRWTRHACEGLLEQQGMSVTPEQGELLRAATEGWYSSLMNFIDVRKKKESASSFNDFAKVFKPLVDLPPKDFEKFLHMSGMSSFVWSLTLASKLKEFDLLSNFSKEEVQMAVEFLGDEDPDFPIQREQADAVVRWWTALRVVEVNTWEQSKVANREGRITYSFIPSIQRAISEYHCEGSVQEAHA
jgi:hypothetical protein